MKRIKTGNWRPFHPAGMSDGMWQTILLLHRFPNDEMDEEEQSHCLGPKLFGKGGARFGDYGRGWIQEEADRLLNEGKTPYAWTLAPCPLQWELRVSPTGSPKEVPTSLKLGILVTFFSFCNFTSYYNKLWAALVAQR